MTDPFNKHAKVAETARQERSQGGQGQASSSGDPVVNVDERHQISGVGAQTGKDKPPRTSEG